MPDDRGHIELDRRIESITVGARHRRNVQDDLEPLMRSIDKLGLLQPITITPDGVLVCGARRLEAVRRLGWRTLKVWVRSGISDELSQLLAQQDENTLHKPLSPIEAASLYRELQRLLSEDAARRQAASRFGAAELPHGVSGGADAAPPPGEHGKTRRMASELVTGTASYNRLEQITALERIAQDVSRPQAIRQLARTELSAIEAGAPVKPAHGRVMAAIELDNADDRPLSSDELEKLAADALARVRQSESRKGVRALRQKSTPTYRTVRSFILTWTELEGWSSLYDVKEIAGALSDEEWTHFEGVVDETVAFRERLAAALDARHFESA
jgi:ParB family chromosome partitioning protein